MSQGCFNSRKSPQFSVLFQLLGMFPMHLFSIEFHCTLILLIVAIVGQILKFGARFLLIGGR